MEDLAADVPAAVGNTPLIRLRRASEETGCEIWGKAEWMNPGGSVKDRAALFIIRDAVKRGLAKASESVKNIKGCWVNEIKAVCGEGGEITEWRVNLRVTFIVE